MNGDRVVAALRPVVELFEQLGIDYQIGGSVAASTFGHARSTLDVDLVAAVEVRHAAPIAAALRSEYYVEAELIRDAVRARSCFNLIFLPAFFKVDVFVVKETPYERAAFARWVLTRLGGGQSARDYRLSTPEDVVLHKLTWYRQGGGTSERQWLDILGLLRVQAGRLDLAYVQHWARELGVDDLLARAQAEATQ